MKNAVFMAIGMLTLAPMFGCSTTVRTMTVRSWIEPAGGSTAATTSNAATSTESGAPAEQGASSGIASQYYLSYWEGQCKAVLGCSRGETYVKRCHVNGDNSVVCTPEENATKALNPD